MNGFINFIETYKAENISNLVIMMLGSYITAYALIATISKHGTYNFKIIDLINISNRFFGKISTQLVTILILMSLNILSSTTNAFIQFTIGIFSIIFLFILLFDAIGIFFIKDKALIKLLNKRFKKYDKLESVKKKSINNIIISILNNGRSVYANIICHLIKDVDFTKVIVDIILSNDNKDFKLDESVFIELHMNELENYFDTLLGINRNKYVVYIYNLSNNGRGEMIKLLLLHKISNNIVYTLNDLFNLALINRDTELFTLMLIGLVFVESYKKGYSIVYSCLIFIFYNFLKKNNEDNEKIKKDIGFINICLKESNFSLYLKNDIVLNTSQDELLKVIKNGNLTISSEGGFINIKPSLPFINKVFDFLDPQRDKFDLKYKEVDIKIAEYLNFYGIKNI